MIGVDILAGSVVAYLVRKARHVGRRADAEVDHALDTAMDRLQEAVAAKLGNDKALEKLQHDAQAGVETERTLQRVQLAVEDAAESDPDFAAHLEELIAELCDRDPSSGSARNHVEVGAIIATSGGVAAGVIEGGVSTGNPPLPGPA